MNFHKSLIPYFLIPLILIACEETEIRPESLELAVVEGFLYANSPVEDIHISRMIPFGSDSTLNFAINDLSISLNDGEQDYLLTASPGDSGYYHYSGSDLRIQEGTTYTLNFSFNGEEIRAETQVPSPPSGMGISTPSVEVQQIDFDAIFSGGNRPNFNEIEPIEISWENSDQSYYYVLVENIDSNPEDIIVGELPFGRPNFNLITEPTEASTYILLPQTLEQFGTHRIVLFKVNAEYVDLYENASQDSRNLDEPLSNVENGLGVFTSFNSDTLYLEVYKQ
ncbi:MAG: DUF4249 family protein [Bacteroidota bacterium]